MAISQSLSVTEVPGSVNETDNTSKVRILWQSTQSGESWNGYTKTAKYYVSINGGIETEYSVSYTLPQNSTKTIVDTTITVTHKDNGLGTVKVRTWMDTGISAGVVEKSKTLTLTTIARASTLTSASNKTLGTACSIKWTPLSKSFRYKLKFSLESWSYTTAAIHPNTTSAYTYTGYMLPITVANQLPSAKTGTMTVTLYTYSNSGASTQIGSPSSKTFTVTVPDNTSTKPTVSMILNPISSLGSTFSSLYIQGKSKVKATFSGDGKYSAEISSYKMYIGGKSYSSSYQSSYLSTPGIVTVKGRAYDSRGYYGEIEKDITVLPYSKPALLPASGESSIICARSDADGNLSESGTYLKIKARRNYSKVKADGVQKNFCLIRYRYRTESTTSFTAWKTLLEKDNTTTDAIDVMLSEVVSSTETAYVVQVGVIDDIGESDAVQFMIPTDFVVADIPDEYEGRSVGVFRHAVAPKGDERRIDIDGFIHGGGIDNLTLGTILNATETAPLDLNDYKIPGNYYSPSAVNSEYIANAPTTDSGFALTVRHIQSESMIQQEVFYSRTTCRRHWNGTEWSAWLRYMMTSEDSAIVDDYVIEVGVSDGWRYRKWKSGAVDMNGAFQITPVMENTTGTAAVRYSEQIQIDLPFAVENFQFTGTPASNFFLLTNASVPEDTKIAFRLLRFTDFSDMSVYVRIIASGRYK